MAPQLPATLFESDRSVPRRSPDVRSGQNRHLATAFRSPGMTARLQAPVPGSKFPCLLLRRLAEPSSGPFGLRLLRSPRLAPARARSPPQTRFPTPALQSRPFLESPLPFRVFWTLLDQSFDPAPDQEIHLPNASGFPSLPAASSIGISPASDQRSRSVLLPEGPLFLEPLGTKCYVAPEPLLQSNDFRNPAVLFLNNFRACFVTVAKPYA
jgi:hypothetical protein